jgi:hypothetical protein
MWVLCVDLMKAENLMKRDMLGKSDPYAVLKYGQQVVKTNTVKNTQVEENSSNAWLNKFQKAS